MSQPPTRTSRVVVVGSLNVDLTARLPTLPTPGETVLGSDLATAPGGKGANQAVAARRLGADVAMIGCVGGDAFGELLLDVLRDVGVDATAVRRVDAPTGVALITTDAAGENTIALAPGANRRLSLADVEAARPLLEAADVCVAQLEVPVEAVTAAFRIASAAGATTVLNVAPAVPVPPDLWQATAVAVLNEVELTQAVGALSPPPEERESSGGGTGRAEVLSLSRGERVGVTGPSTAASLTPGGIARPEAHLVGQASSLLDLGPTVVIVTRGAAPTLFVASGEEPCRVAPPPIQPVDTVGAGDAFVGALAVELRDLSGPALTAAVAFANAAGALAATEVGAQPAGLTRAAVARLLESRTA